MEFYKQLKNLVELYDLAESKIHDFAKTCDFIKAHGWAKAKDVLKNAHWENIAYGNGHYYSMSCCRHDVLLEDLRLLVESYDLIDSLGGLHNVLDMRYWGSKEYCDKQAYLAENTDTAVVNQVPIEVVEKMAGIQFFKN